MKKSKIFYYAIGLMLAFNMAGCSDDEVVKTQLDSPEVTESAKTVSSLTFEWDKVEGAVQYAYELYNPNQERVYGDVTTATAITFTGLTPATTYTLNVWAFASVNSEKTTSPTYVLTATTPAVVQLATPEPTAVASGTSVTVTWPAVENADEYTYTYYPTDSPDQARSRSTRETSASIRGLNSGEYTFTLKAVSRQEAYSNSEEATITFKRERQEQWRVTGTFHSAYYAAYNYAADWDVVMVSYDDGSYSMINWMFGGDGYDLSFTVNDDSSVSLLNTGEPWGSYQTVLYYPGYYMYYYPDGEYSKFTGDKNSGNWYIYEYYGYDTFTWGSTNDSDDNVTFTVSVVDSSNNALYPTFKQTAKKVSDTEYVFADFLNVGKEVTVTNDSNGKLHLESSDMQISYYPSYYDQWVPGPFYFSDNKSDDSYVEGFYLYVDGYSDWSQNCSSWWVGNAGFYFNCQFWFDSGWTRSSYGYIYFKLD